MQALQSRAELSHHHWDVLRCALRHYTQLVLTPKGIRVLWLSFDHSANTLPHLICELMRHELFKQAAQTVICHCALYLEHPRSVEPKIVSEETCQVRHLHVPRNFGLILEEVQLQ